MPVMIAIASLLEVIGGEVESREQIEEQLGQRMIRGAQSIYSLAGASFTQLRRV